MLKSHLSILSLLFLVACNNGSNTAPSTNSVTAPVEKTTELVEAVKPAMDLTKFGIANHPDNVLGGLQKGDVAPDFTLQDQDGKPESLKIALKDGPVLLVFLRAEWCSFCVRHLQAFEANIQQLHEAGQVKVLAISPQQPSYMQTFHQEHQFSFPILYDEDHSVMKDYKVFFHVTEKYNAYIEEAKGHRIEVFNGDPEPVMPVPATYLIGQDQTIQYVHYDPNYKKRSDLKEVLGQF